MTREELRRKIGTNLSGESRQVAELLLEEVFPKMSAYYEQQIQQLKENLMQEIIQYPDYMDVAITICDKEEYDRLKECFYPMEEECLISNIISTEDICKQGLARIWIAADKEQMRGIESKCFEGEIQTDEGVRECKFRLEADNTYLELIDEYRRVCVYNQIPYHLVNTGCLKRFYKVIPIVDAEISAKNIQGYKCSYGELQGKIYNNVFPVWNIRNIAVGSKSFPVMQTDSVYYRYDFEPSGEGKWLFYPGDNADGYVTRYNGKISVFSKDNKTEKFHALEIKKIVFNQNSTKYPIISNTMRDTMWNGLFRGSQIVQTEWELQRLINGFEVGRYIRYLGYEATDGNKLILQFEPEAYEKYITEDIMDFLVEAVRDSFPAFDVTAVLK